MPLIDRRSLFGKSFPQFYKEDAFINTVALDSNFYYAELSEVPGYNPDVPRDIIASTTSDPNEGILFQLITQGNPGDLQYRVEGQRAYFLNKYAGQKIFFDYYGIGNIVKSDDIVGGGSPAVPGGGDTDIQFNDSGNFEGDSFLTWDKLLSILEINGTIKITGGSPAVGKVLTSDSSGLSSWEFIDHNNTGNKQGGDGATEYYHLNNTDHSSLTDMNAQLTDLHTDGYPKFSNLNLESLSPAIHIQSTDTNGMKFDIVMDNTDEIVCLSADQTSPTGVDPSIRIGVDLNGVDSETRSLNINGEGFIGVDGNPTPTTVMTIYDDPDNSNNTIVNIIADDENVWASRIQNLAYSGSSSPLHSFRFFVDDDGNMRFYAPNDGSSPGALEFRTSEINRLDISPSGTISIAGKGLTLNSDTTTTPIFIANSTVVPPTPVGGGVLYVEAGALKYIGSGATPTTIAPA